MVDARPGLGAVGPAGVFEESESACTETGMSSTVSYKEGE
jgi:hypothetical protein